MIGAPITGKFGCKRKVVKLEQQPEPEKQPGPEKQLQQKVLSLREGSSIQVLLYVRDVLLIQGRQLIKRVLPITERSVISQALIIPGVSALYQSIAHHRFIKLHTAEQTYFCLMLGLTQYLQFSDCFFPVTDNNEQLRRKIICTYLKLYFCEETNLCQC